MYLPFGKSIFYNFPIDNHLTFVICTVGKCVEMIRIGELGWLSWLRVQLLILAQVMSSLWDRAPPRALH